MGKDYYKILGVEKNSSPEEIQRAFRKAAHTHHPDKAGGNEAKFKEVNEAYQVLGNTEKRQRYDQFGADFAQQGGFGAGLNWEDFMRAARGGGFGGQWQQANVHFEDLSDILGDLFGGFGFGASSRQRGRARGRDLETEIVLTFREAALGCEKRLAIPMHVRCPHCQGNLAEPGTPIVSCSSCQGSGQIRAAQQTFFGTFQSVNVCSACRGQGKVPKERCARCSGSGVVRDRREITVRIPGGVDEGETLRLSGQGEAALGGGHEGDLYAHMRIQADPQFTREGADIFTKLPITFSQAALGAEVTAPTLKGDMRLRIPPGTESGKLLRIKGKGMPKLRGGGVGDQYVHVVVAIPKKLSRKQKKLVEDLQNEGL